MRTYKVLGGECFAISLVDEPAIEETFIKLKKQIKLDTDKREIFGPVLKPNFPIYRYQDGEEFYIVFDEEAIKQLATSFLQNIEFTIDHSYITNDVQIMESYIDDNGNWMIRCKVLSDELWSKIKNGELNGFSIESLIDMDILNEIKSILSANPTYEEVSKELEDSKALNTKYEEEIKSLNEQIESLTKERDELKSLLENKSKEVESKDNEIEETSKVVEEKTKEIAELKKQPSITPSNKYNVAIKFLLNSKK